jgi:hypothetical protein
VYIFKVRFSSKLTEIMTLGLMMVEKNETEAAKAMHVV